ncbi:hypothetical protein ACFC63_02725 [Streptomyces albidoflavus]
MKRHHEDAAKPASRRAVTRTALLLAATTATLGLGITSPATADSHIISTPSRAVVEGSAVNASGWDRVGEYKFSKGVAGWARSHGTNFRGCIKTTGTGTYYYELWEYDSNGADDFARRSWVAPKGASFCITWKNISAFVDGSDGTAEFYLVTNDPRAKSVVFYD